ncbi:MAG: sugar transferase [Candidatus Fermentibacteraceae bacterium]
MKRTAIVLSLALDGAAAMAALVLASWLKFHSGLFPEGVSVSWRVILAGATVSIPWWWALFGLTGCYRPHWDRSWTDELALVFKPVTTGFLALGVLAFLVNPGPSVGRWIIVIYYGLMLTLVFLARTASRLVQRALSEKGLLVRRAMIVGVGSKARSLQEYLDVNPALGYRTVGFIVPPHHDVPAVPEEMVLGEVDDLDGILAGEKVDELLVTIASNFHQDILSLMLPAARRNIRVKVLPDLFDVVAGHVHNTQILGQPLMELLPERLSFLGKTMKTLFDVVISVLVVVLGLPVWLALAVAIRIDSRGPVFYRQERVGRGGHTFRIFKFRSMVRDAEKISGPVWADRDDPRVTRVGRFMRRTRLDEIPQFLNVLKGDMSVVGPRPERPEFVAELVQTYPFYPKRLTVKPGITGWAQVKLEYDTSIEDVGEKLKFDFFYIENQSLFLDVEILIRTVLVVLTGAGAH